MTGLIALLGLISAATTWLIWTYLEQMVIQQGYVITRNFADNSVFLLLVPGDQEVAQSVTRTLDTYPGVQYVEVVDDKLRTVARAGTATDGFLLSDEALPIDDVTIAREEGGFWHFVAPVETLERAPSETQFTPPAPIHLGYIHVAISKAPVQQLIQTIVVANITVAILLAFLIGGLLLHRVRLLTKPLVALGRVMVSGMKSSGESIRAVEEGPEEVEHIAHVFNELMADRESQSERLEQQVRERTEQLEISRDEALKAEREKSEIMAMFTHEMKAPLHAMDSYLADAASQLDFLNDRQTTDRIRKALQIIGVESKELLHRINQILELRSLDAGNAQIDLKEVYLPDLIHLIDATLRPVANMNRTTLTFSHLGADRVLFDQNKLLQILENVVGNACKFTEDGDIQVALECGPKSLLLSVTDTGVGIAPQYHEKIFNVFYQIDMSDTREHTGSGLGLAIVKRLTELMCGKIALDSAIGRGTRMEIVISLPVCVRQRRIPSLPAMESEAKAGSPR